ncbi:MAG: FadR family transcriptional regulator [Desulfobacteraceae bacterium]|nr:MAG: FadR family transcriptional regulator [Desulfobacteraceae bacterium]
MPYTSLKKGRLADDVTNQIKEAIFGGKYQAGEKLPSEHELVELFGVSRVIIREAIRNLEQAGLVEIRRGPKGGAFIKSRNHTAVTQVVRDHFRLAKGTVKEIMEVRLEIEPIVAGLAAERATPGDLQLLKRNIDAQPQTPGRQTIEGNLDFHRLLARCAHNPIYEMIINILLDFSQELIINILPPGQILHDTTTHPELYRLIKDRDIQGAQTTMHSHLKDVIPLMRAAEEKSRESNRYPNSTS